MEVDVVHRTRFKRQAADILNRIPTAGQECNPLDDTLPVMSVSSPPKDDGKGRIKPKEVIDNCDDTGATATSRNCPRYAQFRRQGQRQLHQGCQKPVTEEAKEVFCRRGTSNVGTLARVTHVIFMESWFTLLHSRTQYKP